MLRRTLIVTGLLAALATMPGAAQSTPPRGQGWGARGSARLYDTTTVTTMAGRITRVDTVAGRSGRSAGIQLILATDAGSRTVHLGPVWFVQRQNPQLRPGDRVKVTGSRVTLGQGEVVLASRVVRGDSILELRDSGGWPRWAGRPRGP
jgi:hypothetical protein